MLEKVANEYLGQDLSVVLLESRDDPRKLDDSVLRSFAIGVSESSWKWCEKSVGLKEFLQNNFCSLISKTLSYREMHRHSNNPFKNPVQILSKRYITTQVIFACDD